MQPPNNEENTELAKEYGIPVETTMRMIFAGNEPLLRAAGRPESDLAKPVPGIPGNTFGAEIVDSFITPA